MEKKFDWNNFWWRVLQVFIIFIANGASIAWLVLNFYGDKEVVVDMIGIGETTLNVSFWDTLDFKWKALVIGLIIFGFVFTFVFIKFLWKNKQEKRKTKLEEEKIKIEKTKADRLDKAFDKIFGK